MRTYQDTKRTEKKAAITENRICACLAPEPEVAVVDAAVDAIGPQVFAGILPLGHDAQSTMRKV